MSYPRSLSYFLNSLSGYSRNKVKFYPQSPTYVVKSGNIIRVTLPQNTIVDMRTFTFNFLGTTTGTSVFPKHIETILDSVSFEINGKPITPATTLNNIVWKTLADYHLKDKETARFLQNGAGVVGGMTVPVTGQQFSIVNWLNFPGTCLPECIDTSALGDCVIVIRLATSQVLANTGVAGGDFQMDNINFVIDTISLDDGGIYYDMLAKRLEQGAIEIPFQYWVSFTGSPTTLPAKVIATISTQSLDMVIGTLQPASYGGASNVYSSGSNLLPTSSSDFFTRGAGSNLSSSTMYLNNVKYPQFDLAPYEAYQHSLHALNMSQDTVGWLDSGINSLTNWNQYYFTHINRFNHPTPADERYVSGIDTRGTMAALRCEFNGTSTASYIPLLFASCTGTLLVSSHRQVEAIW